MGWHDRTGEGQSALAFPGGIFGSDESWRQNFISRNQLGVAYLGGKTPCIIVERGTYNTIKLAAHQYKNNTLEKLWEWDSRYEGNIYAGQGAHFMHAADVDEDGRDEVIVGSAIIDDNGKGFWTTNMGHSDHCYLGTLIP